MAAIEAVNLTNCDREPIHIPGSIQPHGCLLACDIQASQVLRHSTNTAEMLGVASEINGSALDAVIGPEAVHTLRNALATSGEGTRPVLLFGVRIVSGRRFDVAIHRFKSTVIIEFEPASDAGMPLELARAMIGRMSSIGDIDKLLAHSARLVRGLLGYDRVMVYRFEQDGAGQVAAEVKRPDLESFLGQYFPASDIPQQARALYVKNTIRIISDAGGSRVAVQPVVDVSGEPLDLSYAHLRSVSPIHLEYLRNMGVGASMSISIIVNGELWGMIACHHYSPRVLPMAQRVAAEMFGEFFSLHLFAMLQKRRLDTATSARQSIERFLLLAADDPEIAALLRGNLGEFGRLMPSDGVGLLINGQWSGVGAVPPDAAIPALARFVGAVAEGGVFATHALAQRHAEAEDYSETVSGVLAIPLSQRPRDYLFLFRKEMVQTINWAGNPDKTYETGPMGDRLTPRKSFALWKESVRQQSRPWTEQDRETAEAARSALVEIVLRHSELMAEERNKADVRQRMLNEELNHRVKNILAVIKSLVAHPVQDGRSLSDYVTSLKGRIQSLAFAHDQVLRGDGGGLLTELINAEIGPYRAPSVSITLDGPPIWIDARAISVMALVLHELSTNAAKYGALSARGGTLAVSWAIDATGSLEIRWQEGGGPIVSAPTRIGFGTALLDRSVPYDLGGESEIRYAPGGLKARFLIPRRHVSSAAGRVGVALVTPLPANDAAPALVSPQTLRVLLVEDQMLIAMDVEAMLAEKGITQVTTSGSVAEAMRRLDLEQPDVAILDVNLGDGTSMQVADTLASLGIPYVFATGYGDKSMIPEGHRHAPVVRKPYDGNALVGALETLLAPGRS